MLPGVECWIKSPRNIRHRNSAKCCHGPLGRGYGAGTGLSPNHVLHQGTTFQTSDLMYKEVVHSHKKEKNEPRSIADCDINNLNKFKHQLSVRRFADI